MPAGTGAHTGTNIGPHIGTNTGHTHFFVALLSGGLIRKWGHTTAGSGRFSAAMRAMMRSLARR
jgi:hypothetical protein